MGVSPSKSRRTSREAGVPCSSHPNQSYLPRVCLFGAVIYTANIARFVRVAELAERTPRVPFPVTQPMLSHSLLRARFRGRSSHGWAVLFAADFVVAVDLLAVDLAVFIEGIHSSPRRAPRPPPPGGDGVRSRANSHLPRSCRRLCRPPASPTTRLTIPY